MKKYIFFTLWNIEKLERMLHEYEQNGLRLESVSFNYQFRFEKFAEKEMQYFLSYKSFRGASMGNCDNALLSKHKANPVKSKMCYYSLYRTKETKENLKLLCDVRADYIKRILFEKLLTSAILAVLFAVFVFVSLYFGSNSGGLWFLILTVGICLLVFVYYLFGYLKQRSKCKKIEKNERR